MGGNEKHALGVGCILVTWCINTQALSFAVLSVGGEEIATTTRTRPHDAEPARNENQTMIWTLSWAHRLASGTYLSRRGEKRGGKEKRKLCELDIVAS